MALKGEKICTFVPLPMVEQVNSLEQGTDIRNFLDNDKHFATHASPLPTHAQPGLGAHPNSYIFGFNAQAGVGAVKPSPPAFGFHSHAYQHSFLSEPRDPNTHHLFHTATLGNSGEGRPDRA